MPDTPATDTPTTPAPATSADLAATNDRLAELIKTLKEQPRVAAPAPAPAPAAPARPARYTEVQLAALVDKGELTQAQMIAVLRAYDREDMAAEIDRRTKESATEIARESRIAAKQEALIEKHPELGRQGSDLWNACAAAYREMVQDGAPHNSATELAAARQVTAGLARPAPDAEETTHRTRTTESTAPATPAGRKTPTRDIWHGIPADTQAFYEKCLARGQWKSTTDPKFLAVLEGHRARLAAPARRRSA